MLGNILWDFFLLGEIGVKGGTVGIEDLTIDDTNTVFYDLMGNRVVNHGKGIYVKVTGGKSQKVIIK